MIAELLRGEPDVHVVRVDAGAVVGVLAPRGRLIRLEAETPRAGSADELRSYGAFVCAVRSVDDARAALWRARTNPEADS